VVNWSIVPAQAIIAKNMRQAGWKVPLFQSHGFGNIKYVQAAGAAAEGIIFPAGRLLVADVLPDSDPQKKMLLKYKHDYESRFKEEASTFGGHGYDAMAILIEGMKKGGADRAKVREAIENLKGFVGIGGVFNFSTEDHNGLDIDSFVMLTVKDGKFVLYDGK
jgi:branched-chain amino acid transport system substrate-binding protein